MSWHVRVRKILILAILIKATLFGTEVFASEYLKNDFIENYNSYSEEYKEYLKLSQRKKETLSVIPKKYDIDIEEFLDKYGKEEYAYDENVIIAEASNVPTKYDLRDIIDIKVENQGSLGTCWAFASLNSLETHLAVKNGIANVDLSEKHLDYLGSNLYSDKGIPLDREQGNGGNFDVTIRYFMNNDGPVLESTVPYKNFVTTSEELVKLDGYQPVYYVNETISFPSITKIGDKIYNVGTEISSEKLSEIRELIKKHIMENGGLYTSLRTNKKFKGENESHFDDGSLKNSECSAHAVTIIGWDDNYSKDNFKGSFKPKTNGAYLALNSYGATWNGNGCFWISYEDFYVEEALSGYLEVDTKKTEYTMTYTNEETYKKMKKVLSIYPIIKNDDAKTISFLKLVDNSIKELNLYNNKFDNSQVNEIFKISNGVFKNVKTVNLSNNRLSSYPGILAAYQNIKRINLSNNKIVDFDILNSIRYMYEEVNIKGQKILSTNYNSDEIKYPNLFLQAKDKNNYLYSEEGFEFIGCKETTDGKGITIEENASEIYVKIKSGELENTVLILKKSENLNIILEDSDGNSIGNNIQIGKTIYVQAEYLGEPVSVEWNLELSSEGIINVISPSDLVRIITTKKEGSLIITATQKENQNITGQITINIDETKPVLKNIKVSSPNNGTYTAGTLISIVAEYSEDIKGNMPTLKVKFGENLGRGSAISRIINKKYTVYTYEIQEGDNGVLGIYSYQGGSITDLAGNSWSAGNTTITNTGNKIIADTNKPTLTVTGEPTLTIKASDVGSGLKNVTVNGKEVIITNGQGTYTATENGAYKIVVTDNAGNTIEKNITINSIDKTAPQITSVTGNPTSWTNGTVTLKVTATDNESGIKEYSFDGGKNWTTSNTNPYTQNTNEIEIQVKDNAGNIAKYQTINITKIDKTKPTLTVTANPTEWVKNATLKIAASDASSGLKSVTVNGTAVTMTNGQGTYTATENGKYKIVVTDNAGNTIEKNITINSIDKTAPTITSVTGNPTSWTKENVTLKVTATDDESGIKEYSFDGGKTWGTSNTKTYTQNTSGIEIQVKDNAGNITKYQTINITKIDKIAPIITSVTGNPTSWTKENVTLKVTATDDESGIKEYSFDGGKTWGTSNTKTYTQNTSGIEIQVKDNAGNITKYQTINITKIDKTAPTLTVKGDITLTIKASDLESGLKNVTVNGTEVKIINGTGTYVVTENGAYKIVATDNVGNIKEETKTVNAIKKLESISIKTMPTKTIYNKGETLNTKGLVLNLIYDNGTKEEVTTGYTCTPTKLDTIGNVKITVTYEGKTTTFNVTVKQREITISSEVYGIKTTHIAKIKPETKREDFKKNITTNATMKIYDRNGTEIKETDMIATGMKMKLALDGKTEEYKIVVRGDLTGDGKIGNADLLKMARHIVGLEKELKDEYLEAADINLDEKLGNNIDLLKMSRTLVGLDSL